MTPAEATAIRAQMARSGLLPNQNGWYDDPERGHVDPIRDSDGPIIVRQFFAWLDEFCRRSLDVNTGERL